MDSLASKCHHEQIASELPNSYNYRLTTETNLRELHLAQLISLDFACPIQVKMSLKSLPLELLLLICGDLDTADLNALTRTCGHVFSLLNHLLYQRAVKSDEYKSEFRFSYAVIYRQANAVSKFLKAGISMSAFEDYTEDINLIRDTSYCLSAEKRYAVTSELHPLLAAAYFGNIDVTRVLLDEGNVNIDFHDECGHTALHYAIETDNPDMMKLLLEQGARIGDHHEKQAVKAPFVHAAEVGNKNAIELMFNTLQLRNRDNRPDKAIRAKRLCEVACYHACKEKHFDIVDFLLYRGVDAGLRVDQRGLLYWLTIHRDFSRIKSLLRHGVRMEGERDCGIVTLLFKSSSWRGTEKSTGVNIALYLLRSGCNVANGGIHACALWRIAKYSGSKGLKDYLTPHQQKEVIDLLLEKGFDRKRCQHGCFARKGRTSLLNKMRRHELVEYVDEQERRFSSVDADVF